ncbi:hypothetical protein VTP01DRAFT_9487, partial [Rhizomucor pusillus]|uniref:uncharacterized protein n=1 Tax=Rhizomucor pusillus TaxID=4840 RepID=UPI0037420397
MIALQYQDTQSRKKAKTALGKEAANIWNGKKESSSSTAAPSEASQLPKIRIIPHLNLATDSIPRTALFKDEKRYKDVKAIMRHKFLEMLDSDYAKCDKHSMPKALDPEGFEWFVSPECTQIAADAFETPVAFYGSQSYLFLSYHTSPQQTERTHPIVLQLENDHIILVQVTEASEMTWPEVDPLHRLFITYDIEKVPWRRVYLVVMVNRKRLQKLLVEGIRGG